MQDEFVNRLGMFQTALGTLNRPEYQAVWKGQSPAIFETKVASTAQAVVDLAEFGRMQEADTTGAAQQKAKEEAELEQEAYIIGNVLAIWLREQNDAENASKIDMSLSQWRRLRDQQLLEKSRLLYQIAESSLSGPESASLSDYGITAEAIAKLKKETDDYESVLTSPQQAIAQRKARTQQLRDKFNEVESQFEVLDRLILLFRTSASGPDLISAYQASRVIRDLGKGPSPVTPPVPPPETV